MRGIRHKYNHLTVCLSVCLSVCLPVHDSDRSFCPIFLEFGM